MTEPRIIPSDYDQLQKWFNLIRRMNSVVSSCGAPVWVEIGVYIDAQGVPQKWTSPDVSRLEPKNNDVKITD